MKRIILTFGLVLTGLALFGQSPRIRLNQITKDSISGSILISSLTDSNMVYSRDFFIGADTSLNFYGTVLVAGGGGGGSFVTLPQLEDSLLNYLNIITLSDSLANYILKVAQFGGDVTGTYDNIVVVDDSHNHVISNVDGLQDTLDGKLSSVNAGIGLSGSGTTGSPLVVDTNTIATRAYADGVAGGGGTVTSVDIAAGTGITVSGSPITTSGTITVTNSAPDQTVSITGAGINSVTGTYPNFTITGTEVDGSITNELQTISTSGAAGNITLSDGGGTLNLNVNDADASVTNEGSLTVGAGGENSSTIISNTSGSTPVTIAGGSNVTVTESGSTITIASTGGGSSFNNLTETADTIFVAKYLNVDTSTLYVDAVNNSVGIGTSAPEYKLDVNGDFNLNNGAIYYDTVTSRLLIGQIMHLKNLISNNFSGFNVRDSDDTLRASFVYGNKDAATFTNTLGFSTRQASTEMVFLQGGQLSGNERLRFLSDSTIVFSQGQTNPIMTIAQGGKVGIGTTTPSVALEVVGSGLNITQTGSVSAMRLNRTDGKIIAASAGLGGGGFFYDSTGTFSISATSRATIESSSISGSPLIRLSTTQNVGIKSTEPVYDLDVNGDVRADTYYYDVGSSLVSSSDSRLKKNVSEMESSLNKINALNLVKYEWNDIMFNKLNGRSSQLKLSGIFEGMIAQEVESIFPQYVGQDADGYKTLSYVSFIVPLIKATQEQQSIINQQQTQINDLLQRIIQLENK